MPDLTKGESAYFIVTSIVALGILVSTLFLWNATQETCFDRYKTEDAAIEACEQ